MAKTLVIAEKPSVAADIARALGGQSGAFARHRGYFENGDMVVTSAVGHLLRITPPDGVEVARGKWLMKNLPVLPERFDLEPIAQTADQLKIVEKLFARADIDAVINACDAGREGELIFKNLLRHLRGKRKAARDEAPPVRRLWLQSMTPTAIRKGFDSLRDDSEMHPLADAARCRDAADWLVGINSTRAMTALNSTGGGFLLTTVGRVQTPTLTIIVDRESEIQKFVAADYWEVKAVFEAAAGRYAGRWIDPKIAAAKKSTAKAGDKSANADEAKKPERIWDEARAQEIADKCRGAIGEATETRAERRTAPPPLFDLTSLQREANLRHGFSARATLSAAQGLYERHKLLTYPRTDSRALPEDYPQTAREATSKIAAFGDSNSSFAARIIANNWIVGQNKAVFNNAKVSDHFAIIPTGVAPKESLREPERKIYDLVLRRFLGVFFPPARHVAVERRTVVAGETFISRGKVVVDPGWWEVAGGGGGEDLPPLATDEKPRAIEVESIAKQTQPPPRYTEATLLAAMEGAGRFVEDDALREALREKGIGTPATRAATIEGLLREKYIVREQRELIPGTKAFSLVRLLRVLSVEELTQPGLTGEWESKLRRIERADFDGESFLREIREMTKRIVAAAKSCEDVDTVAADGAPLAEPCPRCGKGELLASHLRFFCRACDFFVWKTVAGRETARVEMEEILRSETKSIGPLEGFRSRLGREFTSVLKLGAEGQNRLELDFSDSEEKNGKGAAAPPRAELTAREGLGPCPKCGATVRDWDGRYLCENTAAESDPVCDFSFPKMILQRAIAAAELAAMLNEGKSATLPGFVSKKTRRPFKAALALEPKTGKLSFVFEPRTGGAAKKSFAKKAPAKKTAAKKTPAKKAAKRAPRKAAAKKSAGDST